MTKQFQAVRIHYHQYHLKTDILNLTELGKNMDIKQPFLYLFLPELVSINNDLKLVLSQYHWRDQNSLFIFIATMF